MSDQRVHALYPAAIIHVLHLLEWRFHFRPSCSALQSMHAGVHTLRMPAQITRAAGVVFTGLQQPVYGHLSSWRARLQSMILRGSQHAKTAHSRSANPRADQWLHEQGAI